MLQKGHEQTTRVVVTGVICNLCGESIPNVSGIPNQFEFAVLYANWGYGSGHDTDSFEMHICENCIYQKLMPMMKVQPEIAEQI